MGTCLTEISFFVCKWNKKEEVYAEYHITNLHISTGPCRIILIRMGTCLTRNFFFCLQMKQEIHAHILVILLIKLSIWFDMKYEFEFWINQGMNVLRNVTLYLGLSGSCPFESSYCLQLERSSSSRRDHWKLSETPNKRHRITSLKM
jgi:hypothetical protein